MEKILVIEDDLALAESIRDILGSRYFYQFAFDGILGYQLARDKQYELILLDINLPGRNGISLLRELRSNLIDTPVIILSSKKEVEIICQGIESGADGYLPKPFSFAELKAKVVGILRRPPQNKKALINSGELTLDLNNLCLYAGGKKVILRKKEFQIMHYLASRKNQVITRDEIINNLWDRKSEPYSGTIDVHISNIRNKIKAAAVTSVIKTIHGIGYIFTD